MRAALANLRASGLTSASVHIGVIIFAQFGLPFLFTAPPVTATVIPVDVVRLDDVTRPPPAATPEPEPETTRAASPAPPPRPPATRARTAETRAGRARRADAAAAGRDSEA